MPFDNTLDGVVNSELPWLERVIRQNNFYVHALLGLLSVCTLIAYYLPPLARPDVYTNDMDEHVAWYQAARNPALFHDDLIKDYFTSMSPLGYKAVFNTACAYFDARLVGDVLSLLLGLASVWLAYKLGQAATSGLAVGGIAAVLMLLFGHALGLGEFIKVFQGGLQRAFALPIFLLGTWAVFSARIWPLCAALVLGALFFPPACVGLVAYSAAVVGLGFWRASRRDSPLVKSAPLLAGVSVFCAALLLFARAFAARHVHWTGYTLKEALQMPEFHAGGIWDLDSGGPLLFHRWTDYITKAINIPHPFLVALVTLFFLWRIRRFRAEVSLLIVSAFGLWAIAYLVMFTLFEPSRYLVYPVLTLWLVGAAGAALEALRFLERRLGPKPLPEKPLPAGFKAGLVVAFVMVLVVVTGLITVSRIHKGEGGMKGAAPAEIYCFLATTPVTSKIAADPRDADDIPMRSQRSVLAFRKAMWPYHHEFYEQMKARIVATWSALYATNYADILPLRQHFGADFLLVNEALYRQPPVEPKPYDEVIAACRNRLQTATPLVLRLPSSVVVYRSGAYCVIDLNALDRLQSQTLNADKPAVGSPAPNL